MSTIYEWMSEILPGQPFIIEAGAHHAEDSEKFLEMFPGAKVLAFEPDPRNIPVILSKELGEKFSFAVVEAALADRDGRATFYLSGGVPAGATGADRTREWTYSGSIRRPTGHLRQHPSVAFVGEAEVVTMRLDSFFRLPNLPTEEERDADTRGDAYFPIISTDAFWSIQQSPVIDFIWADVQGAEGDMIRGAQDTLRRARWLYTEFSDRPMYENQANLAEIKSLLPAGFKLAAIFDGDNALFRNDGVP